MNQDGGYLILQRKTIKVYPYAKLAAERLETLNERMANPKEQTKTKKIYSHGSKVY